MSLIISHLTAKLQLQASAAQQREQRAHALFDLSRDLSGALSNEQISDIGARRLSASFHGRAIIFFPDKNGDLITLGEHSVSRPPLPEPALVIARLVYGREPTVGYDEGATALGGIQFLPLRAPMRTRGVLVLVPTDPSQRMLEEQERLLKTCAAQIALALERVHYVEVAQDAMLSVESERLRNSLLSAVSHDVRTPLTAIIGLSNALASEQALSAATRQELARAIQDTATKMNRLVTNLLDMARLGAGALKLNRQWQMLEEVVGSALAGLSATLADARVTVALPACLPLLNFDAVLLERVFFNLLDNAAKYGASGGPIRVAAQVVGEAVRVTIDNEGPGIAAGLEDAIFTKFTRGQAESAHAGVGLGLAICRTIVEAHGGRIWAENPPEGGARFAFTLPAGTPPPDEGLD
jgi:two-component system sensor histidine kinase KdpD